VAHPLSSFPKGEDPNLGGPAQGSAPVQMEAFIQVMDRARNPAILIVEGR